MLGVDGEERDVVFFCGGDDEFAGGYQALFVGQADGFARADCSVGGFEAGYSYDCGDDEVDFREGSDTDAAAVPWRTSMLVMPAALRRVLRVSASFSVAREMALGRQRRHWGVGHVDVVACGQGDDLVAVGEGFADGESAVADGAGRAEDC